MKYFVVTQNKPSPTTKGTDGIRRCSWCVNDPLYTNYHDTEWGRPQHDDNKLYEKLCLEGFQSGLSWITILRKRESFRKAFSNFDPEVVAKYKKRDVERLLQDASIVRHRGKIEAAINNAKATLRLQEEYGSLNQLIWSFKPDKAPKIPRKYSDFVAVTDESKALSKELLRRGFKFVGPTTMYAAMQSIGMVNDHMATCDIRKQIG